VIDFLAELVSLGDLPEKVADIVKGLQKWVEDIIRSVIKFLAEGAKSALASLGIGGKPGDKKAEPIGEILTFTSENETHKLYIQVVGVDARVMVASTPMTVTAWLDQLQERAGKIENANDQEEAYRLIKLARTQLGETDSNADAAAKVQAAPEGTGGGGASPAELDKKVDAAEESLRDTLEKLGKLFGGGPDVIKAVAVKSSTVFLPPYTPNLIADIDEKSSGAIYTATVKDETQLKKVVKAGGESAFDKQTGTLTLPSIQPDKLSGIRTLGGMGSEIGDQTFARKVLFSKLGGEFAVDVGFDFFARSALTGRVLLTPEKRLVDFHANASVAQLSPTAPRYKPQGEGTVPYPDTSAQFQRDDYLKHFIATHPEQKLTEREATEDLTTWLSTESAKRGRLSRVGSKSAVTYILTRESTPSDVVIDTESDQVDPDLRSAVLELGIVPFMKELAQLRTVKGINFERLQKELWPHKPNAKWLADRFRDYNQKVGVHEWIPSSSIPRTIALAIDAGTWLKGEKWIDLHHEMRAETRDLIGKPPEFWVERVEEEGESLWSPQGHDGAVEHEEYGAQTKDFGPHGPFHKALFDNIESSNKFSDCIAGAKAVFVKYIWKDEEPPGPLDPSLTIRGATVTDVQALKADQAVRYQAILDKFDTLARNYPD
jgi:hypothetical protein